MMFGSSHKQMWRNYKSYNKQSEERALNWLQQNCHANWGGTELLEALQSVYSKPVKYGKDNCSLIRAMLMRGNKDVQNCEA